MTHLVALTGNTSTWRRGMEATLVEAGFEVVLLEDLDDFQPGRDGSAVVVGGSKPGILGSVKIFIEEHPYTTVVVVVPEMNLVSFARTVRLGVTGVVDENADGDVLVAVVRSALLDLNAAPPRIMAAMAQLVPDESDLAAMISEEETTWLRSMAAGVTVADLAEQIGYSERAMFRNLKGLYLRLGVRNRTEALLWASRHSLLTDSATDDQSRPG